MLLKRGVVDENVELAQLGNRGLDRFLAKRRISHIAGNQEAAPPLGLDRVARLLRIGMLR